VGLLDLFFAAWRAQRTFTAARACSDVRALQGPVTFPPKRPRATAWGFFIIQATSAVNVTFAPSFATLVILTFSPKCLTMSPTEKGGFMAAYPRVIVQVIVFMLLYSIRKRSRKFQYYFAEMIAVSLR
jgi:hypothetical protein